MTIKTGIRSLRKNFTNERVMKLFLIFLVGAFVFSVALVLILRGSRDASLAFQLMAVVIGILTGILHLFIKRRLRRQSHLWMLGLSIGLVMGGCASFVLVPIIEYSIGVYVGEDEAVWTNLKSDNP